YQFWWVIHGSNRANCKPITYGQSSLKGYCASSSPRLSNRPTPPCVFRLTLTSTPLQVVFAFVREGRSLPAGTYFTFMAQCSEWKTNNIGFPNFYPVYTNSHRNFALTKDFGARSAKWSGTA
ncbi:hypothetical protein AVEN_213635-1, partial [Araneus ventricosus]